VFAFLVGVDGLSDSSLNNRLYIFLKKQKLYFFVTMMIFFREKSWAIGGGPKRRKFQVK
jgi:hypothetical protein